MYDVLPILLGRKAYAFGIWLPTFIKSQRELRKLLKEEAEAKQRYRFQRCCFMCVDTQQAVLILKMRLLVLLQCFP